MRAHLQRVSQAAVHIDGQVHGAIERGLLILLGVGPDDDERDLEWLSQKISKLRIFPDEAGKMNRSLQDIAGGALVVSQFTLFASTKKGTRPAFIGAAGPDKAERCYQDFVERLRGLLPQVETGVFAADMQVSLVNDGPVTILIDSRQRE